MNKFIFCLLAGIFGSSVKDKQHPVTNHIDSNFEEDSSPQQVRLAEKELKDFPSLATTQSLILNDQEVKQIKNYLYNELGVKYNFKAVYFIGEKQFEEVGNDLASEKFPAMLEAAQGALQSLVCTENSRHNKVCFFLPVAWPETIPEPWQSADLVLNTGVLQVSVESGIYAFWFNDEDCLQTAEQKSGQTLIFGFAQTDSIDYFNWEQTFFWITGFDIVTLVVFGDRLIQDVAQLTYEDWEYTITNNLSSFPKYFPQQVNIGGNEFPYSEDPDFYFPRFAARKFEVIKLSP